MCASFHFNGGIWDFIVLVPDHCIYFYLWRYETSNHGLKAFMVFSVCSKIEVSFLNYHVTIFAATNHGINELFPKIGGRNENVYFALQILYWITNQNVAF